MDALNQARQALLLIRETLVAASGNQLPAALAKLEKLGFSDPTAALECCRQLARAMDRDALAEILARAAESFEPAMCLNNWARFVENTDDRLLEKVIDAPENISRFSLLFSFSQSISDQLISDPAHLTYLLAPGTLGLTFGQGELDAPLHEYVAAASPGADPREAITRFKQREMLRVAMRDLLGLATLPQTAGEIAYLAGAVTRMALALCRAELEARHGPPQYVDAHGGEQAAQFAVVAMGKLGGRELNVSSDLDLVFVYDREGETAGVEEDGQRRRQIGNHQFFTRLAERLIAFLMSRGGAAKLYRIDVRLRPEGASGPLARSLESYENYLLTQARLWEKMALIKARCIAGERRLCQAFETMVRQFVFDANPVELLLREILRLKERIDREVYDKGVADREVKRGYGGIREIEFQVSALQLIHGKNNISIRRRSTLQALDTLLQAGLMPREQYDDLVKAYLWLRTVEHRLQYLYEQQAHLLPAAPAELEALARRCGVRPAAGRTAAAVFDEKHRRLLDAVHHWFTDTFGEAEERAVRAEAEEEIWCVLHQELDPEQSAAILAKYNFREPNATMKALRRMAYGTSDRYITAEGQQFFERIFPQLMRECAAAPLPDQAVRQFEDFFLRSGGVTAYYSFIVDYPPVPRLLCRIFGSSNFLAKILIHHPEYLDLMVAAETLAKAVEPAARREEIAASVLRTNSEEIALNRVRRFHQQELLKIGQRFLLGLSGPTVTARSLGELAQLTLELGHRFALADAEQKHGAPGGGAARFAVLGLGKLGAGELAFFSDLDVVYIYDGDGQTAGESPISNHFFFSRVAEGMNNFFARHTAEGKLFTLDARLRPEGKSGPLVVSRQRFEAYFGGDEAQPWEYQAYLRLGRAAGSPELFGELRGFFHERAATLRDRLDVRAAVRDMRGKLECAAALPGWAELDFKRGPGGFVDIEFLTQYLQLAHGAERPEILGASTLETLAESIKAGWLDAEDAAALCDNYRSFRTLEMMCRLMFETADDLLPRAAEKREPLRVALRQHDLEPDDAPAWAATTRRLFDKYLPADSTE